MPRRNAKALEERKREKRQGTALQVLVLGAVISIAPWFFSGPIAQGFRSATPLGIAMMFLGGVLVWWFSRAPNSSAPTATDLRASSASSEGPDPPRELAQSRPPESATTIRLQARTLPTAWSAEVLNDIEWRRFEALVEAFFAQAGFATKSQSHGADGGVDIWLMVSGQAEPPAGIVQCKQWSTKRVGVDKVRELRGVMAAYGIRRGHLVTTSGFTAEAEAFAEANGIALLDAAGLLTQIRQRSHEQQKALLEIALEGEYWRPTCVNCGVKLVERRPRAGGDSFWGCPNYPKCRSTMPLRSAR
jgi:restriction system protein